MNINKVLEKSGARIIFAVEKADLSLELPCLLINAAVCHEITLGREKMRIAKTKEYINDIIFHMSAFLLNKVRIPACDGL